MRIGRPADWVRQKAKSSNTPAPCCETCWALAGSPAGDSERASGNSGFPMDIYLWQFCLWFILIFEEVPTNGRIDWYILSDFDFEIDMMIMIQMMALYITLRSWGQVLLDQLRPLPRSIPCDLALIRSPDELLCQDEPSRFLRQGKIGKCDEMCMPVLYQVRKLLGTWHIQLAHFACVATVFCIQDLKTCIQMAWTWHVIWIY